MKKREIAFLVFVLVSVLDVVGIIFKIQTLILVFKPLILLSLINLYIIRVEKRNKWYILALVFCFLGDVSLINKEVKIYFITGLISFLIAHILFIKIILKRIKKVSLKKVINTFIPFLIIIGLLFLLLRDSLGKMQFPVLIYGLIISLFVTVSLIANEQRRSTKSLYMLVGAIVFMTSDLLLAINKFYYSAAILEILVMPTYILAQYFIYRSMILRKKYLY